MAACSNTEINVDGKLVKAQVPIIVSASRRTDIPAFYADWFFYRLEKGYSAWKNPLMAVRRMCHIIKQDLLCFGQRTHVLC